MTSANAPGRSLAQLAVVSAVVRTVAGSPRPLPALLRRAAPDGGGHANNSPFLDLDDAIDNGPTLVGSPEEILDKVHNYHEAFGHQVLSVGVEALPPDEQRDVLELWASCVRARCFSLRASVRSGRRSSVAFSST